MKYWNRQRERAKMEGYEGRGKDNGSGVVGGKIAFSFEGEVLLYYYGTTVVLGSQPGHASKPFLPFPLLFLV